MKFRLLANGYCYIFLIPLGMFGPITETSFIYQTSVGWRGCFYTLLSLNAAATALWFFFIFGAVLTGAVFLLRGKQWGRGPIVMLNLCLAGVAFYMFTSGAIALGLITAIFALGAPGCMFNPKAVDWAANAYGV